MKQIFTYPNNLATNYIDPDYEGDATSGFYRRVDDLLDGDYRAWTGLDPVSNLSATVPDIEQNISKFNNYYDNSDIKSGQNLTMYDFWNNPLVVANKVLIGSKNVTLGDITTDPTKAIIDLDAAHGFSDGALLRIDGLNNTMSSINGNDYYCSIVDTDTINLRAGATDGPFVRFTKLQHALVTSSDTVLEVTFTAGAGHDLVDGTLITATNLNGSLDEFNNNDYYVQNVNVNDFQLSTDLAGTDIIGFQQTQQDIGIDAFILKGSNKINMWLESATDQQDIGTEINVDADFPNRLNALNNALDAKGNMFISPFASDSYTLLSTYTPGGTEDYVNWRSLTDPLTIAQDLNTSVNTSNNHYKLDITISDSGFTTPATPTFIATMLSPNSGGDYRNLPLPGTNASANYPLVRTGTDTYQFNKTNNDPYYLDNYILNAERVVYSLPANSITTVIPKIFDSNGVEINENALILNPTTLHDLTELDTVLSTEGYFVSATGQAIGGFGTNVTGVRRTGTYNGSPVIDLTGGTFQEQLPTPTILNSIENQTISGIYRKVFSTGLGGASAFVAEIYSRFIVDPDSVLFNPMTVYVYEGNQVGNAYKAFAVIQQVDENGNDVTMQFLTINPDGTPGTPITDSIYTFGTFQTSYQMPFNQVAAGPLRRFDNSTYNWTHADGLYGSYIEAASMPTIAPGTRVSIEVVQTSTGTVVDTVSAALFQHDDRFYFGEYVSGVIDQFIFLGETGLFAGYTDNNLYHVNLTTNDQSGFGGDGLLPPAVASDNRALIENVIGTFTAPSGAVNFFANIMDYIYAANTLTIFAPTYVPATAGDITEKYTPADAGDLTSITALVNSTTGNIGLSPVAPYPYEVSDVNIKLPGNKIYSYQDSNNDTQYGARVEATRYWRAGDVNPTFYASSGETPAQFDITVDGNGRLTGATLVTGAGSEGAYATGSDITFELEALPSTYVAPVITPAEDQDIWDTDDEWLSAGFNTRKVWPDVVTPMSASVNLNTPSTVNKSQNGIKYTRASGFTKWTLDVEYPPMKAEQFREFHAIAQAANGQAIPFFFKLRNADGNSILWADFDKTGTTPAPIFLEPISIGDTTMLLEGFQSFEQNAFQRGEVFIDGDNDNGALHTAVNTVNANVFGEAKIRVAMPVKQNKGVSQPISKNPFWAIVTLDSDDFSYSVDTAGFYYMSVSFALDGWK
jgi:hypothetical protein